MAELLPVMGVAIGVGAGSSAGEFVMIFNFFCLWNLLSSFFRLWC